MSASIASRHPSSPAGDGFFFRVARRARRAEASPDP
jgi:hypothetical protein